MTNEQCKALIMGILEAFGAGPTRAHKGEYADEIMEKAGAIEPWEPDVDCIRSAINNHKIGLGTDLADAVMEEIRRQQKA